MSKRNDLEKVKRRGPRSRPGRSRRRGKRLDAGVLLVAAGLLAFGALVYAVIRDAAKSNRTARPIDGVQSYADLPRGHAQGALTYKQDPPAGGVHNPAWQNCGVYTTVIANENGVHSLEHGAVWITYTPDLPAEEVQRLQGLTRDSGFRLLSPYSGLVSPIVASAWGAQLQLQTADDPRLGQFIKKYELSPLGPEPGAPCTGGVGQPG